MIDPFLQQQISLEEISSDHIIETLQGEIDAVDGECTSLSLIDCEIDDVKLRSILNEEKLQNLRNLVLSDNDIGDDGCDLIIKYLENNNGLERLDLSNNFSISKSGINNIIQACGKHPNLKEIYLPNIRMNENDALRLISLHNKSYDQIWDSLQNALNNIESEITYLSLVGCNINDEILKRILNDNRLGNLKVLDLSGNNIGDKGGCLISNYLQNNKNIQMLNLDKNFAMGEEGIYNILKACKTCYNLWKIRLPPNGMRGTNIRIKLLSAHVLQENPSISIFADMANVSSKLEFNAKLYQALHSLSMPEPDYYACTDTIISLFKQDPVAVDKWFKINEHNAKTIQLLNNMLNKISVDCNFDSHDMLQIQGKIRGFLSGLTYKQKKQMLQILKKQYPNYTTAPSQESMKVINNYISYYAFENQKSNILIIAFISFFALVSVSGFAFNICTYNQFSSAIVDFAYQEIFPDFYIYDLAQIFATAGIWIAGGLLLYKMSNEECKVTHTLLGMGAGIGMFGAYYFVDFLISRVNEYIFDHYLMFGGGGALAGIFFGALSILLRGYSMIESEHEREIRRASGSVLWSLIENKDITMFDIISTFTLYIIGGISIAVVLPYLSQTHLSPLIYNAELLQLTNFSIAGAIGIATAIITSMVGYYSHISNH